MTFHRQPDRLRMDRFTDPTVVIANPQPTLHNEINGGDRTGGGITCRAKLAIMGTRYIEPVPP